MARTLRSDKFLFWATLLLLCASMVMVYSASAVQAQMKYHRPYYFLFRQLAWGALGFALLLGAMRVDYHQYRRPALIWSLLGAVTLGLLAVFLFGPNNGARRWISIARGVDAAVRAGEAGGHRVFGGAPRAAHAPRQ